MTMDSSAPILFIIFNRPDRTQLVFNEIRRQKPKSLFVHADGPRAWKEGEVEKCKAARGIIDDQVDWPCDLHRLYREDNLGCGKGPASAITWFFENVEEGIIIEDDCIPHPHFFLYCSELLDKYRFTERVMVIGGATYRDDYPCKHSYTFTAYGTMAAWATWRRVWKQYDYRLSFITPDVLSERLKTVFYSRFELKHWLKLYDWIVKDDFSDYWDWQLSLLILYKDGLAIRPCKNLISNIGIGEDATHTKGVSSEMFSAFREVHPVLPLEHPESVSKSKKADSVYFKKMYKKSLWSRFLAGISRKFNKLKLLMK